MLETDGHVIIAANGGAEGVETEEQARLLRLLRCDQYQGYPFSKPVALAEIEQILLSARTP